MPLNPWKSIGFIRLDALNLSQLIFSKILAIPWVHPPECNTSARRQKAEGKKACKVSFLTFFNWIVISAILH
jgi:hypothetical protein